MEEYCINELFIGHITAEFKFDILDVFRQHFSVHNIVVVSFRSDMIVIQTITMTMVSNMGFKGLYTTMLSLESIKKYDFKCNKKEVNVMVSKMLINATSNVATGCNVINVVASDSLVEVSFDLIEKKRKRSHNNDNSDNDGTNNHVW